MEAEIRDLIQQELPRVIAEEPTMRDFVLRTVSEYYTPRTEFDQKFDRVLDSETNLPKLDLPPTQDELPSDDGILMETQRLAAQLRSLGVDIDDSLCCSYI